MAEAVYHPSFRPPFLSPEKAALQNSLCLRAYPWSTGFGSGSVTLSLLPDIPNFPPACVLDLDMDGTLWQLEADSTAMLLRHDIFRSSENDAPLPDERLLPAEVRRALLESLLTPTLDLLRSALNRPLSLTDARFSSENQAEHRDVTLGFKADFTGENLPDMTVFLRLSPLRKEDAAVLGSAVKAFPVRSDGPLQTVLKGVPLEVTLESGYLLLNAQDVAALGREDVLIPETWTLPETLTLRVRRGAAKDLTAVCDISNGQAVLRSPLSEEPDPLMDNPDLKDMDIRLSFELERRIITVGELESLAPGYTFALESDMNAPVTIRANGKAVARGRLVDMNGTLGVQIAETL